MVHRHTDVVTRKEAGWDAGWLSLGVSLGRGDRSSLFLLKMPFSRKQHIFMSNKTNRRLCSQLAMRTKQVPLVYSSLIYFFLSYNLLVLIGGPTFLIKK